MGKPKSELSALVRDVEDSLAQPKIEQVPMPRVRWRTRVLLPAVILLVAVLLLATAARDAILPVTEVRVVPVVVKTGQVSPADGTIVAHAPGWVEADPFPIAVTALADGVVEEVLVLEGEHVEQDQIVARLIKDDAQLALDRAVATLAEREAALAAARATLQESQRNWDHPIELTRKLKSAEAQLAEKQAELKRWPFELAREAAHAAYLKAEFDRVANLKDHAQASDIEFINAKEAHAAQAAAVEAMRSREPIIQAQIAIFEAEVQAAADDLRLRIEDTRSLAESEAEVLRAEAAADMARVARAEAALRLERMDVRASSGGIVMTRLVEPGSKVMLQMDDPRSAQIVRLYDPQKLQVRVDVPLVDAAKVGVGQQALVIVDVLPDREFRGHVSRVVHEADVQKNTLQVKVAIKDPVSEIKPEMLARAKFLAAGRPGEASNVGTNSGALCYVPKAAVLQGEQGPYVWLADQVDRVARRQRVETADGAAEDGYVCLIDGVQPGDRVIVDAPATLADGSRIRLVEVSND